jgi:phage terminase large subunit-like protein
VSTGVLKTLASNADRLDGYNPSYVLIDEYHAHKTDEILRVMMSGVGARDQPLINIITTAGFDLDKPCYEYRQGAINVLNGQSDADDLFTIIFTLDEGDDYTDGATWEKSNPALGHITKKEDLQSDFNQAKVTPSLLNNFLTKNLNLWINNDQGWIEENELDKVFDYGLDISDFKGQECYIGVDLSSTRDLTACVLLFEREGQFYAFPYFFMANNPQKKIRKGGINLGTWIRQGLIIECSTKTIDYDLLFDHFEKWHNDYIINAIGYDYYNSALIIPRVEALGVDCIKVPQTAQAFNFPVKYTEKLIYDDKIKLTSPVLKWMIRNVVLYQDGNGNQKFLKNKSLDSIDGAVALAEAVAMWIQTNLDPERLMLESYLD